MEDARNGANYQNTPGNMNTSNNMNHPAQVSNEYKPISMWGYFGYEILFAIPVVGFILLLVFSFGGTQNKNLKNFARSYFCIYIILAVLLVIIIAAGGFASLFSNY